MDLLYKIIIISILVGGPIFGTMFYYVSTYVEVPPMPDIDNNTWWGPMPQKTDTTITPFQISASNQVIDDLKNRLKNLRAVTPPLEGMQQQYGLHPNTLKPVLDYWINKYDWPAREKFLNQYPQFTTNIQGLNIHYIHLKPNVPTGTPVLPMLILHGWPSSVREYYKLIAILTKVHKTHNFVFETIVPSLPGFGFSDSAIRPGLGAAEISIVFKNLMLRLGHHKFYVHGSDWGSIIITQMATLFPQHILGLHTNFGLPVGKLSFAKVMFASFYPALFIQQHYITRMYPLTERLTNFLEESAYIHMHATKPDTIGIAINDSPAGLAGYILEKFSTLTNSRNKRKLDGGLLKSFTYDELLDNLMLYWIPQSFTTSVRLFAESLSKKQLAYRLYDIPISADVPCGVARFPHEAYYYPNWILEDTYTNLMHWTDFTDGGHFPALEVPHLLGEDIFTAVGKMRNITNNAEA